MGHCFYPGLDQHFCKTNETSHCSVCQIRHVASSTCFSNNQSNQCKQSTRHCCKKNELATRRASAQQLRLQGHPTTRCSQCRKSVLSSLHSCNQHDLLVGQSQCNSCSQASVNPPQPVCQHCQQNCIYCTGTNPASANEWDNCNQVQRQNV